MNCLAVKEKSIFENEIRAFSIRFFMETATCSFQLRVYSFTLPRFQILARRSLFSAAMLFFVKSKCITFIAQKTGITRVQKSNKHIADE